MTIGTSDGQHFEDSFSYELAKVPQRNDIDYSVLEQRIGKDNSDVIRSLDNFVNSPDAIDPLKRNWERVRKDHIREMETNPNDYPVVPKPIKTDLAANDTVMSDAPLNTPLNESTFVKGEDREGTTVKQAREGNLYAVGKGMLRDQYLKNTLDYLAEGEKHGADAPTFLQAYRDQVPTMKYLKDLEEEFQDMQIYNDRAWGGNEKFNPPAPLKISDSNPILMTQPPGMIEGGNIDLSNRPQVKQEDGRTSTVYSMSFQDKQANDGKEILIPRVSDDGRILTEDEAIDLYRKTGNHLGKFDTPENASAYAEQLHSSQEAQYPDIPLDTLAARGYKPPEGIDVPGVGWIPTSSSVPKVVGALAESTLGLLKGPGRVFNEGATPDEITDLGIQLGIAAAFRKDPFYNPKFNTGLPPAREPDKGPLDIKTFNEKLYKDDNDSLNKLIGDGHIHDVGPGISLNDLYYLDYLKNNHPNEYPSVVKTLQDEHGTSAYPDDIALQKKIDAEKSIAQLIEEGAIKKVKKKIEIKDSDSDEMKMIKEYALGIENQLSEFKGNPEADVHLEKFKEIFGYDNASKYETQPNANPGIGAELYKSTKEGVEQTLEFFNQKLNRAKGNLAIDKHFKEVNWNDYKNEYHAPAQTPNALSDPEYYGFNLKNPLYKGRTGAAADKLFEGLPDPRLKGTERGLFFTNNRNIANSYDYTMNLKEVGGRSPEFVVKSDKTFEIDWRALTGGFGYDPGWMNQIIDRAHLRGADMVVIKNIRDVGSSAVPGGLQEQFVLLNPSKARYSSAEFHPEYLDKNALMKSMAGLGLIPPLVVKQLMEKNKQEN